MQFALNDNDNSSYSIVIKDIYSSGCIIMSQDIARYHYSLPVTTSSQSLSVILLGGMVVATVNTGLGDNRLIILLQRYTMAHGQGVELLGECRTLWADMSKQCMRYSIGLLCIAKALAVKYQITANRPFMHGM